MSDVLDLIRTVAAENDVCEIDAITKQVASLTPSDQLMDYYVYALRGVVEDALRRDRNTALDKALADGGRPNNRSPKRDSIRNWWAEMLASPVHVGDSYKILGECTQDDLQVCIDERETAIRRIQGQIANYQTLIDLVVKHGVRTVGELPAQQSWGAAA